MSSHSHAPLTGFVPPCLPIPAPQPPSGGDWLHAIKHDGFRVIARKDSKRVKLYSPARQRPDEARFPLITLDEIVSTLHKRQDAPIYESWEKRELFEKTLAAIRQIMGGL